jgi:hypothetical protein
MFQPAAIATMEIHSSFEFLTDRLPVQAKRFAEDRWIISSRAVADGAYVKGVWITRGNATEYGRAWIVAEFDGAANGVTVSSTRTALAAISDAVSYVSAG